MNASIAEQQRRIHELEMRSEQPVHAEDTLPPPPVPAAPEPERREEMAPPPPPPVRAARDEREERATPPRRVEAPRVEEPRIDPKELLDSAGLVMIETDRSKAVVQAPAVEAPQPAGRPRRERPKPQPQDDALVQIETRK